MSADVACSPKTDPGVMRVFGPAAAAPAWTKASPRSVPWTMPTRSPTGGHGRPTSASTRSDCCGRSTTASLRLPPNFGEFSSLLNAAQVERLLLDGYAVAFCGVPQKHGVLRPQRRRPALELHSRWNRAQAWSPCHTKLVRQVRLQRIVPSYFIARHEAWSHPALVVGDGSFSSAARRAMIAVRPPGRSSDWESAWFGSTRSQVQTLSPRLRQTPPRCGN